jgi:hypothetical protein
MVHGVRRNIPAGDAGIPPFRDVVAYLAGIILSVAVIILLLPRLMAGIGIAWVFMFAFCLVIGYCSMQLARGLFPGRLRRCPVCSLVREIIEIDSTVR